MSPDDLSPVHRHNRQAWDALVRANNRFTRPVPDNEWNDLPAIQNLADSIGESIVGKRLLCLAAGGGKHSALYAKAGADVTVVDISSAMLELDRQVAAERGLQIRIVQASMDDLSMFPSGAFDFVIQPVSSCYVPQVQRVFAEVARITVPAGLYLSQHKNPASLQVVNEPDERGYSLSIPYYSEEPLPPVADCLHRDPGMLEFIHRWDQLLGGICRAGFTIEDFMEPNHARGGAELGSFGHRSQFLPPYFRVKARRRGTPLGPVLTVPG